MPSLRTLTHCSWSRNGRGDGMTSHAAPRHDGNSGSSSRHFSIWLRAEGIGSVDSSPCHRSIAVKIQLTDRELAKILKPVKGGGDFPSGVTKNNL